MLHFFGSLCRKLLNLPELKVRGGWRLGFTMFMKVFKVRSGKAFTSNNTQHSTWGFIFSIQRHIVLWLHSFLHYYKWRRLCVITGLVSPFYNCGFSWNFDTELFPNPLFFSISNFGFGLLAPLSPHSTISCNIMTVSQFGGILNSIVIQITTYFFRPEENVWFQLCKLRYFIVD